MLEKPDLQDERIIACLHDEYELEVIQITFLPLGADQNTAVYRAVADDEIPYFLKLRSGVFDQTSVVLPSFLSHRGIRPIIAPLSTKTGHLWANLDAFKLILYPFVEGQNAFEVDLSDRQWSDFGTALKSIHSAEVPPALIRRIRRETYSPQWRDIVETFLKRVVDDLFDDPVAVKSAALLRVKRPDILDLVGRAERHALILQEQPQEFVLCHSDIHAGNILIDTNGTFYIVDWDDPILASKERDLMFVGGGVGGVWNEVREEELFYEGYGETEIDSIALAYYRYERIIEDIAIYCEQILSTDDGGEDREQSFQYLASNFLPNNTIEIAYKSDKTL